MIEVQVKDVFNIIMHVKQISKEYKELQDKKIIEKKSKKVL